MSAPYGALVLILAGLTVWALVRRPKVGFLGLWFFTTLSPTSSIVPIATEVGAERRMYLPLAAIVVLAVVGLAWAAGAMGPRAGPRVRRGHRGLGAMETRAYGRRRANRRRRARAGGRHGGAESRVRVSRVPGAHDASTGGPTPRAQHSLGVALLADRPARSGHHRAAAGRGRGSGRAVHAGRRAVSGWEARRGDAAAARVPGARVASDRGADRARAGRAHPEDAGKVRGSRRHVPAGAAE